MKFEIAIGKKIAWLKKWTENSYKNSGSFLKKQIYHHKKYQYFPNYILIDFIYEEKAKGAFKRLRLKPVEYGENIQHIFSI